MAVFGLVVLVFLGVISKLEVVLGHGYMVQPKARNVYHDGAWKGSGDIQSFAGGGPAFEKINGHGLCGGENDGDPTHSLLAGSPYGPTPVQATYTEGQTIDITVQITAHHYGWFEFRLCKPADGGVDTSVPITQECLNQHILKFDLSHTQAQYNGQMETTSIASPADYANVGQFVKCDHINDGPTGSCCNGGGNCSPEASNEDRWVLPKSDGTNLYTMKYKLPDGVFCERCVLQWYWQTGNSPSSYPEAFWNCADIKIQAKDPNATPPPQTTGSPTVGANNPTGNPTSTPPGAGTYCVAKDPRVTSSWCTTNRGCEENSDFSDFCTTSTTPGDDGNDFTGTGSPSPKGGQTALPAGAIVGVLGTLAVVLAGALIFVKRRQNRRKHRLNGPPTKMQSFQSPEPHQQSFQTPGHFQPNFQHQTSFNQSPPLPPRRRDFGMMPHLERFTSRISTSFNSAVNYSTSWGRNRNSSLGV